MGGDDALAVALKRLHFLIDSPSHFPNDTLMRAFRFILPAVAILAMLWAQVFGMQRGYACHCAGVLHITAVDHCHGPHSEGCHDHDHADPCHSSDDHADREDTHEHDAIVESLTAHQASIVPIATPEPALAAWAMPEWLLASLLPVAAVSDAQAPPWVEQRRQGHPWPQVLAHSIALRV